jgi:hypothetical protein
MADTEVLKWIIMTIFGFVVWFMKRDIDSKDQRITILEQAQQDLPKNYLHKDDFKEFKVELRGMFEEIKSDIRELKRHE